MAERFSEELQNRRETLRGRVRDALEDGVLDACEESGLEALREELGLSEEDLLRLVRVQREQLAHQNYCPNCGESLSQKN